MSDAVLRSKGMNVLVKELGSVEAERFITLIIRDNFDYTEWRKNDLEEPATVEELSREASEYFKKAHPEIQ